MGVRYSPSQKDGLIARLHHRLEDFFGKFCVISVDIRGASYRFSSCFTWNTAPQVQLPIKDNDRPMRAATGPAVRSSPTRVGSSTRVSTWLQRPSRRRYAAPSARPHSFHELASETWLSESDPFASGFLTRHSVERKLPSTCVPTS
ncbi:hypothetical protein Y032_0116g618 [Ancylostoma ceylanicum]|nr:hypothetical protein Y032_0116g618 [Ancylostoma ceylanicum]